MKKKKLKIEDLKIQSFVTSLSGQTETVHLLGGTVGQGCLETHEQSCNDCYSNQGDNCGGTGGQTGRDCWTQPSAQCTDNRPCTGGLCEQSANPPCY